MFRAAPVVSALSACASRYSDCSKAISRSCARPRSARFAAQGGGDEPLREAFLVHVDADAHYRVAYAGDLRVQLGKDAAKFFLPEKQIVRPSDIGLERSDLAHRLPHRETSGSESQSMSAGATRGRSRMLT